MLSKKLKSILFSTALNTLFWTLLFTFILLIRFYKLSEVPFLEVEVDLPMHRVLVIGVVLGILVAIPYTVMEFALKRRGVYQYSLLRVILNRTFFQFIITVIVLFVVFYYNVYIDSTDPPEDLNPMAISQYAKSSTIHLLLLGALLGSIVLSIFRTLEMKIGEGIFFDLLVGKYRQAKEEDRAFLFLDLKSSTTIAEELGHELYSFFIQDCFRDLHIAVESTNAEIYQYVGDEAVLTWPSEVAVNNNNCLRAFFEYESQLQSRAAYYKGRYGVAPIFKAGLNMGKVMTAEVGVVKRDIAYHSDVLNTAARIQSLCNEKGVGLLVSQAVIDKLVDTKNYVINESGGVQLRGKLQEVTIYEVTRQ